MAKGTKSGSGSDSTKKAGSTQPKKGGDSGKNPGGKGSTTPQGKSTPVVAKGGATQKGPKSR